MRGNARLTLCYCIFSNSYSWLFLSQKRGCSCIVVNSRTAPCKTDTTLRAIFFIQNAGAAAWWSTLVPLRANRSHTTVIPSCFYHKTPVQLYRGQLSYRCMPKRSHPTEIPSKFYPRTRGQLKKRTAVPFWGQTMSYPSNLSPNRDCASRGFLESYSQDTVVQ